MVLGCGNEHQIAQIGLVLSEPASRVPLQQLIPNETRPSCDWLMVLGDSKTAPPNSWPALVRDSIEAGHGHDVGLYNGGVGGTTVGSPISSFLDTVPRDIHRPIVLINFGVNSFQMGGSLPSEQAFKASYRVTIDAVLARYPCARIYVARPWRSTLHPNWPNMDAAADVMAGWIAAVVAEYPKRVRLGQDERGWMRNGDNGATMTLDGVHYSETGNAELANQWSQILGF